MSTNKMKSVKTNVKKTLASAAFGAMLLWSVTGTYTLEFIGRSGRVKVVDVDIDSVDPETGDFTAEAFDERTGRVWEVVGTVVGDKVELEFANPLGGERIVAVGEIDEDGNLAGRAAATDGEEFEWEATDGTAQRVAG